MVDFNDVYVSQGLDATKANIDEQLAVVNDRQQAADASVIDSLLRPPPKLAKEGYHGILRDVVDVACKTSEASPVAVAANFLATFSAMIGRVAFQHIGDGTCHSRPNFLFVGRTGKARKGTSEYTVKRIFDAVELLIVNDNPPRLKRHESGMSTGEGLGHSIRDKVDDADIDGTDDKRLLVIESEFASAMAVASREKNTLSAYIRMAWDGKDLGPQVKNAKWRATAPHICILGHITSEELRHRWNDVDAQSGFLNRFVILHIVRAKLVALPYPTPTADIDRLAGMVVESVRFAVGDDYLASNTMQLKMSQEATTLWCDEYPSLTEETPGIAGALLVRVEIYCRMFAGIFALLDKSAVIEPQHIRAALAWIAYWKASVVYNFQDLAAKEEAATLDANSKELLEFIRANPNCTKTAITTKFKNKLTRIAAALNHLMNTAPPLIVEQKLPRSDGKPGRGTTVYRVIGISR